MNETIDYYNNHAKEYFDNTSQVDLELLYKEFLKYVPAGGRIMDLGCGSGRDVKWFRDHGYDAYGLDASQELVNLARETFEIPVEIGSIEEWITDKPFDGIWCCASLLHLDENGIERFFSNMKHNLKPGGVLFMSVKSGIDTGEDADGRYCQNYDRDFLTVLLNHYKDLTILSIWYTEDKLSRDSFKWLNALITKSNE